MITIDDGFLESRRFSGRVIVCFDRGVLQMIKVEETAHHKDPEMGNKLLKHGVRVKREVRSVKGEERKSKEGEPQVAQNCVVKV